jgi:hypothetical protein
VLDRFILQAILQVLQPRFDPTFSKHSHGFRPGRNALGAVCEAQRYIQEGRRVVVDADLERFFDRVNHDVLMGRLEQRIGDKRMLGLIRRYLEAGIMANGVVRERHEGTPQGEPLSPLLANVLLNDVDWELEKRGLAFVRYAEDLNVYVRSKRAGEDAMQVLRRLYGQLRLRINEAKSAVDRPWNRTFLGYSFWVAKGREVKRKVASNALDAMKNPVRAMPPGTAGEAWRRCLRSCGAISRMEGLLPSGRHAEHLQRPRSVDSSPPACRATQAVEAWNDGLSRAARPGCPRSRLACGRRPGPTLVEDRGPRGASNRAAHELLRPDASTETCWLTSTNRNAGCGPAWLVVWEGNGGVNPAVPYPDTRAVVPLGAACHGFRSRHPQTWIRAVGGYGNRCGIFAPCSRRAG